MGPIGGWQRAVEGCSARRRPNHGQEGGRGDASGGSGEWTAGRMVHLLNMVKYRASGRTACQVDDHREY